jgi:hypothetical protein
MKQTTSKGKAATQTRSLFQTDSSAGQNAVSIVPPDYGIDFVDSDQTAAMPIQRSAGPAIQAKLKIGRPGDEYEQEADRIADKVISMSGPVVQQQAIKEEEEEKPIQARPLAAQITPLIQRQPEEEEEEEFLQTKPFASQITPFIQRQLEEEEEEELQMQASTSQALEVTPSFEARINAMKGGGQALPQSERDFFEPRFGCDFSQVRVHTDTEATKAAKALNAKAFTTGHNVTFGPGQYAPETSGGKQLLAHELTHVVQQNGASCTQRSPWLRRNENQRAKDTTLISEGIIKTSKDKPKRYPTINPELSTALKLGTTLNIMSSKPFLRRQEVAVAPEKVEKGETRKEIIGTKAIDKRRFCIWLEKRLDVIPKTKTKIVEKFIVVVRSRTYQESSDTITTEWSIGGELGLSAKRGLLAGAIKGGYKKSWKTEHKKAKRDEQMIQLKIPIKVMSREVDRREVLKSWYEWKRIVGHVKEGSVAIVEKAEELELEIPFGNVEQLGFAVETPDGSYRQFWPRYLYIGPIENLETQKPYEQKAAVKTVSYIRERAWNFAKYARRLFEAGL